MSEFFEAAIMDRLEAGNSYAESLIGGAVFAADNDPEFIAWKNSPDGMAASQDERSKKIARGEKLTQEERQAMIEEILDDLEKLGLIPPKAGDAQ